MTEIAPSLHDDANPAPLRKRRRKNGAALAVLVSVLVHVLIALLIWRTRTEQKFRVDANQAVKVTLARPASTPFSQLAKPEAPSQTAASAPMEPKPTSSQPESQAGPQAPEASPLANQPKPETLQTPSEVAGVSSAGGGGSERDQGDSGRGRTTGRGDTGTKVGESGGGGVMIGGDCDGANLYLTMVMSQLREAFMRNDRSDRQSFHVMARLWFNKTGSLQRAQLLKSTGDAKLDTNIVQLLAEANVGEGMPQCLQPFTVSLNEPWDSHAVERSLGPDSLSTTWQRGASPH